MKIKYGLKFFLIALAIITLISCISMEVMRERGEVVYIQPHEYTPEIIHQIKVQERFFAPFAILTPLLIVFIFIDFFKFLVSDLMDGKLYKVIFMILMKGISIYFAVMGQWLVADAEDLLHRAGKFIVPPVEFIYPYIIVLGIILICSYVKKTMENDYRLEVINSDKYKRHKAWRQTIKTT